MASRAVLGYPHPMLLSQSRPIEDFDDRARRQMQELWKDLRDTANSAGAPALSAPQIRSPWRAVWISSRIAGDELFLVNPEIESHGDLYQHHRETCASVPGVELIVQRWAYITIVARKANGDHVKFPAADILAQCLQHEINHLNGRTLIECANPAKRRFLAEQTAKLGGGSLLTY